jgi:hypothetical protein
MAARYPSNRIAILAAPILLVLCSAASAPVLADNLTLGAGSCAGASVGSGAATVTCTPFNSAALVVTYTETGNLATGVFGTSSLVSDSGGSGLGSGADSGSSLQVTYLFGGLGVPDGTAEFDLTVNGTAASNTGTANAQFETPISIALTVNGVASPTQTALGNGISDLVITTPISGGSTELQFALALTTNCAGVQQCTSSADFLDPLSVTGASAFDSNGDLVSDATFVSNSGFNPNAVPVSAPEPTSVLLLGLGLLGLVGISRLKLLRA